MRNSDDTFPQVACSHIWHIYNNSLNACLSSANPRILPDADMITSFMSSESPTVDWADYHAAFRACFSTATIWISDSIEKSDKANDVVLYRLLAPTKTKSTKTSLGRLNTVQVTSSGTDVAKVALPLPGSVFLNHTEDCSGPALKMSVPWSSENSVGALLSVWNTRYSSPSNDWITLTDISQALQEKENSNLNRLFLFSSDMQKALLLPWTHQDTVTNKHQSLITSKPLLPITLQPAQYNIFSIVTALSIVPNDWSSCVSCTGLTDKYAGLMAIVDIFQAEKTIISARIARAEKCGFLVHGKTLSDVHKWTAKIDKIKVDKDQVELSQLQDCILFVVDMIKHLERTSSSDRQTTSWQIDLVEVN